MMFFYRGKINLGDWAVNEGITIMFPGGFRLNDIVYACWQWTKMADGRKKQPGFYTTIIDDMTVSSRVERLRFHDGYYTIDGAFLDGINKFIFTIRGGGGETGDGIVDLVDEPTAPPPEFASAPRIFIGKLTNWGTYAVDEMMVMVFPDGLAEGDRANAFWQWTKVDSGAEKVNAHYIAFIKGLSRKENVGQSFYLHSGGDNDYYRFDITVDQSKELLTYTMKNPAGDSTGELTLDLQELELVTNVRKKRSVGDTTEVINDTNEVIACSLTHKGSGAMDAFLGMSGWVLGQAGFVAAIATALGTGGSSIAIIAAWSTVLGWAVGVGGAIQVFSPTGEEVSATLFPGDSIERTARLVPFFSGNDVHLLFTRVSNQELSVYYGKIVDAGNRTLLLRNYMPGNSQAPKYTKILPTTLPANMSLVAYQVIVIGGVQVERTTKDMNKMEEIDIKGAVTTVKLETSEKKWYGTLTDCYNDAINARSKNAILFSHDPFSSLTITLDVGTLLGKYASILPLDPYHTPKYYVLRLTNCTIAGGGALLYNTQDENEIIEQMKQKAEHNVYKYTDTHWLEGYTFSRRTPLRYNEKSEFRVYLRISSMTPYQRLANKK